MWVEICHEKLNLTCVNFENHDLELSFVSNCIKATLLHIPWVKTGFIFVCYVAKYQLILCNDCK